jgi:hypothetical protein
MTEMGSEEKIGEGLGSNAKIKVLSKRRPYSV